jgi:hypothetical protein
VLPIRFHQGTDRVVKGPTPIGTRFKGLNASFASKIDAAVNWGNGFVYLLKDDEYRKYDPLTDRTESLRVWVQFGLLGGSFTDSTPASFSVRRKSSVNNGSRSWIR